MKKQGQHVQKLLRKRWVPRSSSLQLEVSCQDHVQSSSDLRSLAFQLCIACGTGFAAHMHAKSPRPLLICLRQINYVPLDPLN